MDFKKIQFCNQVSEIISLNPDWAADAIKAVNSGVGEAVKKWQEDQSKMAGLLLFYYLHEKQGFEISKEDKLRTIEYLKRYFKMDNHES